MIAQTLIRHCHYTQLALGDLWTAKRKRKVLYLMSVNTKVCKVHTKLQCRTFTCSMAVPGGWASVIVRSSFPLARSHIVICIRNKMNLSIWLYLINMNDLFAIKIVCQFKGLLRLTCPLAKPHSSRVQSWLILRADTAPYSAPVAVVPRQRRRAWFWSEIKIH